MNHDPQGYYERLDLDWDASAEAIHAAYRRKARQLHPDIPVTGNADAFVALKQAYDVLSNPLRRAAYDRAARSLNQLRTRVVVPEEGEEIVPAPPPPPFIRTRGPRLTDLPLAVWAGLAIVVLFTVGEAVMHFNAPPANHAIVEVPPNAPTVAPQVPPAAPRPLRLIGTPNVYVIPAGTPALVLRYDQPHDSFVPIGQLPAFSAAQAVRVLRDHGLVEIRLSATTTGFVDAARLEPGNLTAARAAYCTYNSGPPPSNGEILLRRGTGDGQTIIQNHSGQSVVVKLRDSNGLTAAEVYLEAGGQTLLKGLPNGTYRPDYAIGELWSRACNGFAAGMRAQRFPALADLAALNPLLVPPDLPDDAQPVDISDQDFEHE
jgi:hypothetical protein